MENTYTSLEDVPDRCYYCGFLGSIYRDKYELYFCTKGHDMIEHEDCKEEAKIF